MQVKDLVTVKQDPRCRNREVIGGFVSHINTETDRIEVCLLDAQGNLVDTIELGEESISLQAESELRAAFDKYQQTVDSIAFECNERARKYRLTQAALAKKYKLSQDEIYAIYQGMLDYETYYDNHLE